MDSAIEDGDDDVRLSLKQMVIGSTDVLTEEEIPTFVPDTWNDQPPLLEGPRGIPESPQLLKGVLRQGVPPPLRCAIWLSNVMEAVHPHQGPEYWHEYRTLLKAQALGQAYDSTLAQIVTLPTVESETRREREERTEQLWRDVSFAFHDDFEFPQGTTESGRLAHKRVCMALQRLLGLLDLAPMVPSIVAILLTAQSESYAFCAVREMAHASSWYFPVSTAEEIAWGKTLADIMGKLHPQTAEYLEDRGVWDDLAPVFRHGFTTLLPLPVCQRILDIYTLEGSKVLFRIGVALFVMFKNEASEKLITISNSTEWWKSLKHWSHDPRFQFDAILRKAYGIHGRGAALRKPLRFPRRRILYRIIRMEEERALRVLQGQENTSHPGTKSQPPPIPASEPLGLQDPALQLVPDETIPTPVFCKSWESRMRLAEWMPLTLRMVNLNLLYSTNCHGRSLEMFYNRVQRAKHTLLFCEVLSASTTTVVGMYAPQVWRPSGQVYGDGSCFLFRLQPNPACWKWSPTQQIELSEQSEQSKNNETALLEQFMVSTHSYISMGGNPDGSAGLRFNEDFTRAESSPATGFANDPLHGESNTVFDVGLVEVYGLIGSMEGRTLL